MARELTERQRYWLDHIQASERTGGTMKAYAQEHGLIVQELYQWKSWLVRKGILNTREDGGSLFERLIVERDSTTERDCCLRLPNGVVMELSVPMTTQALRSLLQAAWSLS